MSMSTRTIAPGSTFAIEALGCRLSQADAADAAAALVAAGLKPAADGQIPDVIIVHGCAVTRRAERDDLRRIRSLKADARFSRSTIVATGCVVSCNACELFTDAGADIVIAKKDFPRLADILLGNGDAEHEEASPFPTRSPLFHTKRALLKVQDGCDMRCAYCVVPFARGPSVSRPFGEAIDAARALLGKGYKELVVTGCNLATYHDGTRGLADLASAVADIAAEHGARVRIGSLEPGICDDEILDALKSRRAICRFLHLPLQSMDDAVLKAMGRPYTSAYIIELLARIRSVSPLAGIGADIITGLPGEDEDAFGRTCAFVNGAGLANVHVFPYSPRQMTVAATMPGRPSRTTAKIRASRLRALAAASAMAYRRTLIGQEAKVLVEGFDQDGLAYGWNEGHVRCRLSAPASSIGQIVPFTPSALGDDGTLEARPGQ